MPWVGERNLSFVGGCVPGTTSTAGITGTRAVPGTQRIFGDGRGRARGARIVKAGAGMSRGKTMKVVVLSIVLSASVSSLASGYIWRTHNGLTRAACALARQESGSDEGAEKTLEQFLDAFCRPEQPQDPLPSRAGNPEDVGPWVLRATDEDYRSLALSRMPVFGNCLVHEPYCGPFCTRDHFHPPLPPPIGREDAIVHARGSVGVRRSCTASVLLHRRVSGSAAPPVLKAPALARLNGLRRFCRVFPKGART